MYAIYKYIDIHAYIIVYMHALCTDFLKTLCMYMVTRSDLTDSEVAALGDG